MSDLQRDLTQVLSDAAQLLRDSGLPTELAAQMERLAEQVNQPCVVAVVGRVKAGKSTFINALLGQDLAKVGTTETTATINYFRHGPHEPDRPVRCYWRGGQQTVESRAFLDGLQGNDEETLRRAEAIDHLEYHLVNPYLEQVTLVDTPGTGAVVTEHENATAEFMRLQSQLRERHDQETQKLAGEADAVIYLIGETARAADQDFLEEFRKVTQGGSRSLNAVGVMAKIDLNADVLARRDALAAKIAGQLKDSLNTVVPVSAGIERELDRLLEDDPESLARMMSVLRRLPSARLAKMLEAEGLYLRSGADGPLSIAERQALRGKMPWMVFRTMASMSLDPELDPEEAVAQLRAIAGFDRLREVLERHFFRRSQLLRNYRIVNDARRLLNTVKYKHVPEFRKDAARVERFLAFIQGAGGDPATAQELATFIQARLEERKGVEVLLPPIERKVDKVYHELEEFNADFEAIQDMEDHAGQFSDSEQDELRSVLGVYGIDNEKRLPAGRATVAFVEERQQAWRDLSQTGRSPVQRGVASRAVDRYGLILRDMLTAGRDETVVPV